MPDEFNLLVVLNCCIDHSVTGVAVRSIIGIADACAIGVVVESAIGVADRSATVIAAGSAIGMAAHDVNRVLASFCLVFLLVFAVVFVSR